MALRKVTELRFRLVDVFASTPLSGNSLTVVITDKPLEEGMMQRLTVELRQFETIFLSPMDSPRTFAARVFTMEEELDFAGHPVIGAAAVLHEAEGAGSTASWTIALNRQLVRVESWQTTDGFGVSMLQAAPTFGATIPREAEGELLDALGLQSTDRYPALPMQMVSTGLPYLIVPVSAAGLGRARIHVNDFEQRLAVVDSKFVYLLDVLESEGRTWDNFGRVEDIATGSAAGPAAAYLVEHGLANANEPIIIRQGRFMGRPSEMRLHVTEGASGKPDGVELTGDVRMIATGTFDSHLIA